MQNTASHCCEYGAPLTVFWEALCQSCGVEHLKLGQLLLHKTTMYQVFDEGRDKGSVSGVR